MQALLFVFMCVVSGDFQRILFFESVSAFRIGVDIEKKWYANYEDTSIQLFSSEKEKYIFFLSEVEFFRRKPHTHKHSGMIRRTSNSINER